MTKGKKFDSTLINIIVFVCLLLILNASTDTASFIVNFVVLMVMYFFLWKGLGRRKKQTPGLFALRSLTHDLSFAVQSIQSLEEHCPENIREVLQEENNYESTALKSAIKDYFDESDALVRRGKSYYSCNIADYVNDDLLNKVGNTAFNDFISSVMTGLGILGTFVGLAIGLQSFHTETAEAMTNSIAPLIEGIKVAFYTSIFGVLLSLVYGTLYKYRFKQAEAAAEEFVGVFYRYSGYRPENEAVSRLLQFQEEQTDSMNQFAEEISIALADAIDKALVPALNQLPEQMSQAIQSNISPAMNAIGNSIHDLADELTQNLTQAQNEGVEDIVNNFLDQMDQAVGGQMENLGNSIQAIFDWQKTTSEKMDEVVDSVCENAESVSVINEDLKEIVSQLATYIATMDESAEKLHEAAVGVEQLIDRTANAAEGYKDILDSTAQLNEQICEQQKTTEELVAKHDERMRVNSEFIQKQSEQLRQTCEGVADNLGEAAERLATVGSQLENDLGEAMVQTYAQFDSQLAKAITHFSGTLAELRDIVEKTPKIVDSLSENMKKDVAGYLEAVQDSQKDSSATILHTTSEVTAHIQKLADILGETLSELKNREASLRSWEESLRKQEAELRKNENSTMGAEDKR